MEYKIIKIHPKATLTINHDSIVIASPIKEETETKLNLLSEGYVNFSDFTKQFLTLEETDIFTVAKLENSIEKLDHVLFTLREKYRWTLGEIK